MKFSKSLPLFVLAAALGISSANASTTTRLVNEEKWSVGKGDMATEFAITPDIFAGDVSSKNFTVRLGANYFLTDILAPGLEIDYTHLGGGDAFRMLPNLRAYWPGKGRFLPFAMLGIGYAHAFNDDGFDMGIGLGFDYMLTSSVAIGMQFRYDLLVGNGTVHELRFPIDFGIYFKI